MPPKGNNSFWTSVGIYLLEPIQSMRFWPSHTDKWIWTCISVITVVLNWVVFPKIQWIFPLKHCLKKFPVCLIGQNLCFLKTEFWFFSQSLFLALFSLNPQPDTKWADNICTKEWSFFRVLCTSTTTGALGNFYWNSVQCHVVWFSNHTETCKLF